MRTKLITALRIAANKIESREFDYKWTQPSSCNCGVVACAITSKSAQQMAQFLKKTWDSLPANLPAGGKTWRLAVGQVCPVTGMPDNEVFRALFEAGLTSKDIVELEFLRNPQVVARMDLHRVVPGTFFRPARREPVAVEYNNRLHAAAYMRAWADLILEQERDDTGSAIAPASELVEEVAR